MIGRLLRLYTVGVGAWLVAWQLRRDSNGWLAMLNAWAFWLLLSGLPAGVVGLARRSGWLAAGWGVALLALLRQRYADIFRRPRATASVTAGRVGVVHGRSASGRCSPPDADLHLLSANLLHKERDLSPLVAQVHRHGPDVVLVQELLPMFARQLEGALAHAYPYRYWHPHLATNMGFGLLSRLPLAVTGLWLEPGIDPYALRATLALPCGPVDLYNVQFVSPINEVRRWGPTHLLRMREAQVRAVLDAVATRDRPAVVMGDWNSTEASGVYTLAAARLADAWAAAGQGPGWTWPRTLNPFLDRAALPLLRLDYCFHTAEIVAQHMQVVTAPLGSDHCPIVAHLRVNGSGAFKASKTEK